VVAFLLAAVMAAVAYYMLNPVDWDGLGRLGAIALLFPLHLLIITVAAAGLGFLAWRRRARSATSMFGLVVVLTGIMALAPNIGAWQRAGALNVPLSLAVYLANVGHLNMGLPQPERSVVYGTAKDGTRLELDVWSTGKPDSGPLRPAIVIVHGGAWSHGHRSMLPAWDRWLNELGYEVFDVEHRLAPRAHWQDEVGDVKCALGWVAGHATQYGVDPARISTMGFSAGGNLAMVAAYSVGDPLLPPSCDVPPVEVRSVVNIYGPADLVLGYRSSGSLRYVQAVLRQYIGGTPEEFPERYRALSPISHVGAKTPPTFTILGESDRIVPVNQAHVLDQALTGAGVAHETVLLPGHDHGFDVNWGGFGTQIARDRIRDFLQRE
jgi:acetyl esterase/lipase